MYAIIRSGGKQYRVKEGDTIDVELLKAQEGSSVKFDEVLFISNGTDMQVGAPHLTQASVMGELLGMIKGPKTISFKYKRRKSSSRKKGHRQAYSRVKITKIEGA